MDQLRPLLTVTIPTIGRPTLCRALGSIRDQVGPDQLEIIVVADTHAGPVAGAAQLAEMYSARYCEYSAGRCTWGHAQRQFALPLMQGRWLAWLDDDDAWTPEAWAAIAAETDEVDRILLFRMRSAREAGRLLWDRRRLYEGGIGMPCIVVPNRPERLGEWSDRYQGDFDFIRSTIERNPDWPIAWREQVLAEIRPE
jgi:glycosyltransferase involved in cell wall biosynthesis